MPVLEVLLVLLLAAWSAAGASTTQADASTADEDILLSEVYGGPHGDAFSDMSSISLGQTLSSITVRGDERVDAISVNIKTPAEATWDHGGSGGEENVLTLGTEEYIDSMEIHWGKKGGHTRVFYLKVETSEGNSVSAGEKTDDNARVTAPEGFQLSGFYGRAASEVDQLGAIWTRRSAKAAKLKDRMGTAWYGKKIRNWVGPSVGVAKDSACYRQMQFFNSSKRTP
uniref:Jacalin-type lectin domain-containing protein n=1 Tax=Phytophthora ramorum TaxID=164328 RepID=H3H4X2_PHYRM